MTTPDKSYKPIGWYLKEADTLITRFFNTSLEDLDITRFHWQVIKTIADEGRLDKKEYYPRVNKFLTEQELENILLSLLERGWLHLDKEDYFLQLPGRVNLNASNLFRTRIEKKCWPAPNRRIIIRP